MRGRHWIVFFLIVLMVFPWHALAGVTCDGVDDRFTTGVSVTTFGATTSTTYMAWVRPAGTETFEVGGSPFLGQGIMGDDGGCIGFYRAVVSGTESLIAYVLNDALVGMVSTPFTTNAWTHIAMTQDTSTLTFYKDGVSVGTASVTIPTHCGNMTVCRAYTSGLYYNGAVEEIETFNAVLTAAEIANKAKSRLQGPLRASGTAYWPLSQCSDGSSGDGVAFVDRTGNGRSLTGDNGANNTGLTCRASDYLSRPWGIQ